MTDETTQVIELEFQGVKYVLEGSVAAIQAFARLLQWSYNKHIDKKLHEPGEHFLDDIITLSDGKNMAVVNIPGANVPSGEMKTVKINGENVEQPIMQYEKICDQLTKAGVPYAVLPDLDPSDGKLPIAIPPQYADVCNAIIESYQQEIKAEEETKIMDLDMKIRKCKAKIDSLPDGSDEKVREEIRLENLQQAKHESELNVEKIKEAIEKGSVITYEEYLASGKGTEFERDPELALQKYDEGINISLNFKADEVFTPIRCLNDNSIGKDGATFYKSPVSDVVVRRDFKLDQDGLVYSDYSFTSLNGEQINISDKGMTAEQFKESKFPEILEKMGLLADSPVRTFSSESELASFINKDSEIKANSDIKVAGKNLDDLSSAETKELAQKNLEAAVKRQMYEKAQNTISIPVQMSDLTANQHSVALKTPEGEISVSSHDVITKNGEMTLLLRRNQDYPLINNGSEKKITADEVKSLYNMDAAKKREQSHSKKHGSSR